MMSTGATFYGVVVSSKRPTAVVPRPQTPEEPDEALHISQVCIPATSALPLKARISLMVKVGDGEPICVATLSVGHVDTVTVSVLLDEYAELSIAGHKGAEVHVSGYYSVKNEYAMHEDDEDDDDDDDDDEAPANGFSRKQIEAFLSGVAKDADDDDDDDDDEADEDDENDAPGETRTKHTHIKELKQEDDDNDDDDDDGPEADEEEDDEDEEGDDDDEDDDVDEEDMEEMLKQIAEENATKQAAKKRKAEELKGEEAVKKAKAEKKVFGNGFEVHAIKTGPPTGKQAKPGKRAVVKYKGTLQSNGKIFDQTTGNKTFAFRLGVGEVIKGWDKGVAGMRVGDKRKLIVPPVLAYGATGIKDVIPPNSTLVFEIELVDVR